MFAPNLKPKETALDKYDMNSIKTNNGNNPNGQPAGTNREKNFKPCFWNPRIVAPKRIEILKEKVKIKWEVEAKLYGRLDIRSV